jgi:nitrogen fixation protein
LSSTTLIPLLTNFNDKRDIEEKVVDVGMDEVWHGNHPLLSL